MVAVKLDINHETFQVFPEYYTTFFLAVRMYSTYLFIQGLSSSCLYTLLDMRFHSYGWNTLTKILKVGLYFIDLYKGCAC